MPTLRVSSLDKLNSDVTSPEIGFCLAPVRREAWFSSLSLFDPPQCRQGNLGVASGRLGWREGLGI